MIADRRQMYGGTTPGVLRVEWRADGSARLRITALTGEQAAIDLLPPDVAELSDELRKGPDS